MKEQQTNEKEEIEVEYIDHDNYKKYIGKTVKVTGNVRLGGLDLTKLPINFTEVGESFYCSHNKLTSLKGAPEKVGKSFYCRNNKLTSLVGAPKVVGGNFGCWGNKLKSFKGEPEFIGGEFISLQ